MQGLQGCPQKDILSLTWCVGSKLLLLVLHQYSFILLYAVHLIHSFGIYSTC